MRLSLLVLTLALLAPVCFAQEAPPTEPAPAGPVIDPQADAPLRAMCQHLAGLKAWHVQVRGTIDVLDPTLGQMLQFGNDRELRMQRPDKLAVLVDGDRRKRDTWFDGKLLTIVDHMHSVYAVREVPGDVNALITTMERRFRHPLPLADLLKKDPYKALTRGTLRGSYIGQSKMGRRRTCHHLAFAREDLDWQIWIDTGDAPLPRKLLVTYKDQDGAPQDRMRFVRWDTSPTFAADAFAATVPDGFEKIDFHTNRKPKADTTRAADKTDKAGKVQR